MLDEQLFNVYSKWYLPRKFNIDANQSHKNIFEL